MSYTRTILLTSLAMIAFASNSLLCRIALKYTGIDAASFTTIRLISGAIMLWLVVKIRRGAQTGGTRGGSQGRRDGLLPRQGVLSSRLLGLHRRRVGREP